MCRGVPLNCLQQYVAQELNTPHPSLFGSNHAYLMLRVQEPNDSAEGTLELEAVGGHQWGYTR